MDAGETLYELLSELHLQDSPEYVSSDSVDVRPQDKHFLDWGHDKIGADSAVFQRIPINDSSYPLVYFRCLDDDSPKNIAEAHRLAWNMGRAPLLFIVTSGKVRVYSTYERPRPCQRDNSLDDRAGLIDTVELVTDVERARQVLRKYRREELLSGRFWEWEGVRRRFQPKTRVERNLLENLSAIRRLLVCEEKLDHQIVHSLLGRAIFIQYLQDRTDSRGYSAFPQDYFEQFLPGAASFVDILADKQATYALFDTLEEKFNGDIFPTTSREQSCVKKRHLDLLAQFLRGKIEVRSRQLSFWPHYSFDAIPIEFISNMYEEFFHYEKEERDGRRNRSRRSGTYYTPQRLVEFTLDEVLPWEGTDTEVRILDPACGSGIFLVEAYRRLISRWSQANPRKRLDAGTLKRLLVDNLHGIDQNPEAVRIAAFSLCLTMCDYLEPRHVWTKVTFPPLRDKNLRDQDFFDIAESPPKNLGRFDLVVGNPPWESQLSQHAETYLRRRRLPVGDNQIAQAFLWGAPRLCKDTGKVCMIAPSKGLLFNASGPNKRFRRQFFQSFKIHTIVNFASLRRNLFAKAVGPAAPIIYEPARPSEGHTIVYCCPKPMNSAEDGWHYVIESRDICRIPWAEAVRQELIWKTAMWGGPRDWELVNRLAALPTLRQIADERGWVDAEGFIVGSASKPAPWLTNRPYVAPDALRAFTVDESSLPPLTETHFYRAAESKRGVFHGPHILVRQSPTSSGGFIASLLENEAVFNHSILGIAGSGSRRDAGRLGAVCVAFAANVYTYFAMMTSSRWLVERDELDKGEIMKFPLPTPLGDGSLQVSFAQLRDATGDARAREGLIRLISDAYNLSVTDKALISDAVAYTLDYFRFRAKSQAARPAGSGILREYAAMFSRVLRDSFGHDNEGDFPACFYSGDGPLVVLEVVLSQSNVQHEVEFRQADDELSAVLAAMDRVLLEEQSTGVYVRRDVHIYHGDRVLIAKRNQERLWTQSAAMRDADDVYADIMKSWGEGAWR